MKRLSKLLIFLMLGIMLTAFLTGCDTKKEETFRNAKVIGISGTAALLRGDVSMELYEGLVLQGGDQITTGADGRVDLKLDDDKYVILEANTKVTLELQGDPQRGAIRLHQVSGTIHHTIENPLTDGDSYEVHTPDAVMAVRGTEFTTIVNGTDQGSQTTTQVQDGSVEMTPNNSEEPGRTLGANESATVGTESGGASHFLDVCPVCSQNISAAMEHQLSCGNGHYSCDGNNHDPLPCGHFVCTEGSHDSLSCGEDHYTCDGKDHDTVLSCGNLACTEGHSARGCGHCVCIGSDGAHSKMPCGHYTCNQIDAGHYRLSCGNYDCRGGEHWVCYGCENCVCTGDHSQLSCGHLVCQGGTHDGLPCGHFSCSTGSHDSLSCGHYACDGLIHDAYHPCGNLLCTPGHDQLECGHCICEQCTCAGSGG